MQAKTSYRFYLLAALLGLPLAGGCGGGGGGGGAPAPGATAGQADKSRMASLVIQGLPDGARVYVDGQPQLSRSTEIELLPGVHEIVLVRAGYHLENPEEFKALRAGTGEKLQKTARFSRMKPPKLTVPGS